MNRPLQADDPEILDGKVVAILAYLSVLCIIPLVIKKNNSFVLQHGRQGLVIFLGEVAVFVAHILLGTWFLKLGMFLFGVVSLIGIIFVLRGEHIKFPLIDDLAQMIKL